MTKPSTAPHTRTCRDTPIMHATQGLLVVVLLHSSYKISGVGLSMFRDSPRFVDRSRCESGPNCVHSLKCPLNVLHYPADEMHAEPCSPSAYQVKVWESNVIKRVLDKTQASK